MSEKPIYVREKHLANLLSVSVKKLQKDRAVGTGLKSFVKRGRHIWYHLEESLNQWSKKD